MTRIRSQTISTADSDGDGVPDVIEGHDANIDGYGNWDTDSDMDSTDEVGYNADADGDGIQFLFDTEQGLGNYV